MHSSIFLAQLIGWYLFLTSLSWLINQAHYKKVFSDFLGNQSLLTFAGAVGIIFGLLIVLVHNKWVSDWPILVTIIGWLTLLQGAFRLLFPEGAIRFTKNLQAKLGPSLLCWIWLLIGLYLIWVGHTCASC
ncbi:MAG: hypothetical protein JSS32_02575 [Verrucomicrobia bacterium]|nr:hypothetical protein [Verrucomicrobiota bacterium]